MNIKDQIKKTEGRIEGLEMLIGLISNEADFTLRALIRNQKKNLEKLKNELNDKRKSNNTL